jgi:hypothetical protein
VRETGQWVGYMPPGREKRIQRSRSDRADSGYSFSLLMTDIPNGLTTNS